ncbi:MAG: NgoFVII family restriction endonuclease [Candidatus Roizmanbacteria bacterium]
MFINDQLDTNKKYYEKMLKVAGSLSNLFSESKEPYLGYRLVENLFCRSFQADNLSRSDTSIDALKDSIGIGIKTFTYRNGNGYEKIAEFNKELDLFKGLDSKEKVQKVSELRNERIDFAQRTYGLSQMLYHCVARDIGKIVIYETPMAPVQVDKIGTIVENRNSIRFSDGLNNYNFNTSKSTLYKQFQAKNILMNFPVQIISDPFIALEEFFIKNTAQLIFSPIQEIPHVFLPIFSVNKGTNEKYVAEKSGLNQWNAAGRPRNLNEVYIPIPSLIHKIFPDFFPSRDTKFTLRLPNKSTLTAKVCQDGSKALMSDPNADLGQWILRDVLKLKDRELLTYEKLERLGLDAVVIYKIDKSNYHIDFAKIGSYDEFLQDSQD